MDRGRRLPRDRGQPRPDAGRHTRLRAPCGAQASIGAPICPATHIAPIPTLRAVALQAQSDLTTAYDNAAGQAPNASISGDLGGQTLPPGVYNATSSIGLTGTLTPDAAGDPNAVWLFQGLFRRARRRRPASRRRPRGWEARGGWS
ncbi:ice-binding family protein [Actinacidiphila paucisporea]|uniref:ice-binding family protein n=1 Tax=Actinacidiphila paucisporea TaxID=310782 RepID=UPI0009A0BFBE|nr:ice-binding family protein [Actinacidiphila paucisporea]